MNGVEKRAILIGCILACTLSAGCPPPESDKQACKRAMRYTFACLPDELGAGGALGQDELDAAVTLACAGVPEGFGCGWSEIADCITGFSCDDLVAGESALCADTLADLEDPACFPGGGFCGPIGPAMLLLPIALVGLRFARRGWVC